MNRRGFIAGLVSLVAAPMPSIGWTRRSGTERLVRFGFAGNYSYKMEMIQDLLVVTMTPFPSEFMLNGDYPSGMRIIAIEPTPRQQ